MSNNMRKKIEKKFDIEEALYAAVVNTISSTDDKVDEIHLNSIYEGLGTWWFNHESNVKIAKKAALDKLSDREKKLLGLVC